MKHLLKLYHLIKSWFWIIVILFFVYFAIFPEQFEACIEPLEYSIGSVDNKHEVSRSEFLTLTQKAERMWEDEVGIDLFNYNSDADFKIHLLYTELQNDIDKLSFYNNDVNKYNQKIEEYENNLAEYNSDVDYWNSIGGAPDNIYYSLLDQADVLDEELNSLNLDELALNGDEERIDELWENEDQGEYLSDEKINVFAFVDFDDLRVTLAHELGHHYIPEHSTQKQSIMYYTEGVRPQDMIITSEDILSVTRDRSFCTN